VPKPAYPPLMPTEVGVLRIFLYLALGLSLYGAYHGGDGRDYQLYAVVALAGLATSASPRSPLKVDR
jgi:hypothetical protein